MRGAFNLLRLAAEGGGLKVKHPKQNPGLRVYQAVQPASVFL